MALGAGGGTKWLSRGGGGDPPHLVKDTTEASGFGGRQGGGRSIEEAAAAWRKGAGRIAMLSDDAIGLLDSSVVYSDPELKLTGFRTFALTLLKRVQR